ncbi:hypothetical protein ANO14919_141680 [Xylariales sp. No.14919]|nr:hypothetical protein ANO14919_141680 [Xylariales sp. No.14919]
MFLDVGCGPGIAARTFDRRFRHTIKLGPSEWIFAGAKELGRMLGNDQPIRFAVSGTEDLSGVVDGSADCYILVQFACCS